MGILSDLLLNVEYRGALTLLYTDVFSHMSMRLSILLFRGHRKNFLDYGIFLSLKVRFNRHADSGEIQHYALCYSNFDKQHYKDIHSAQCTEPTPLALNNYQHFSSNSTKCSVVIENAVGYSFLCKLITRQCHGCPLVGKCKILFFTESA